MKKLLMALYCIAFANIGFAQEFITRWDLSKPGLSPTSITFGVGTTDTVSYTWETIPAGTAGSGTFTGNIAFIMGLPAGSVIRLNISPTNFIRMHINDGPDKERLVDVEQWGAVAWITMVSAFYGCTNLNISATDLPFLTSVNSFEKMFYNCTNLNGPVNIGNWNISNVNSIAYMFWNATSFNQPIGNWTTTNVTNMFGVFSYATNFNQPIGNWNTTNVTTMSYMFSSASNFDQPIGTWNTINVIHMIGMLRDAISFNQPINNWNTANVTNTSSMFAGAISFNQPIGTWNTINVTNMAGMFFGATSFNQPIGTWNTASVTHMVDMFNGATSFNHSIDAWNTSNVQVMSWMFSNALSFNQPIGSWNTSNVTDMNCMFNGATSFNQVIGAWNTSNVIYMAGMFKGATSFNQPIATWNTSSVLEIVLMFKGATNFNQPIGTLNISNVTDMSQTLDSCGMDCINYSITLNDWASNPNIPLGINLGALTLQYGVNAQNARNFLFSTKGWTINGDFLGCCLPSYSVLSQTSCDSYFFNGQVLLLSGIYSDTLLNATGCDSIITLNLTINQSSVSSITDSACTSYIFNGQTFTSSGIYSDTLINAIGCDSIITLNLTINQPSSHSIADTACNIYVFTGQIITNSGIYSDTFINATGCDSIITLNLTINNANIGVTQSGALLTANAVGANYQWLSCPSYTPISGEINQSYIATTNGYYAVVVTENGCTDTSDCFAVVGIGITEFNENETDFIVVYPNPASTLLNIKCEGTCATLSNTEKKLFNSLGQLIFKTTKNEMDVSKYPKGIYYLKVCSQVRKVWIE